MGKNQVYTQLFVLAPDLHSSNVIELDVQDVRMAANGAVFDVLLRVSGRGIDRNHNLLAAGIAHVRGFVIHADSILCSDPATEPLRPFASLR